MRCRCHLAAVALVVPILLLAACQPAPSNAGQRSFGTVVFRPCTLAGTGSAGSVQAQCARLQVAEDPTRPAGRRIALRIAWLEAGNGGGAPDPVVFIAGGPGQAATGVAATIATALAEVRKHRDIFLIDQRGTGGSHPLTCLDPTGRPLPPPAAAEGDATVAVKAAALANYARQCATSLRGRADPRQYTTSTAVTDLDAVRAALGVTRLNLVAVSYGTRLAQQYLARYPARVRTLTLDGVVANDLVIGSELADTFEQAIARQAAQCRREPACARRFPHDLQQQLRQVVERLRAAPVPVDYRDPASADYRHGQLGADTVSGLALAFSYTPQTAALLPLVLDEAAAGRYGALMAVAELSNRQFTAQINLPMQWSVICAEDADRYRSPPTSAPSLLGADVARLFYAACAGWPRGARPANFTAPLRSKVPALLLSGELDPVTPPRYAERVAQGLPNARHLRAPGQGHNVMGLGCMPRLLARFLDSADARGLDVHCVDELNRVPAFVSFNGWAP